MKTKLLLSFFLCFCFYFVSSQVPQGINYQAIARSSNGKEIVNTALQVKISILTDTSGFYATGGGTYIWEELQNVTTNSFGLFTLILGSTTATKVAGSAASFSVINWNATALYIGTKINYQGTWRNMGTSKLGSVPYSMITGTANTATKLSPGNTINGVAFDGSAPITIAAGPSTGPFTKLAVKSTFTSPDSVLFEVKNNTGQTVFAVYNEGIRAYVDNGIVKGATKGGFAIGGFETVKGTSQPLMMISPDSARVYVDETAAKSTKGGFAIGGFNTAKGTQTKFMLLTPSNYFIGHNSGQLITSGTYNSTLGYETGKALVGGSNNIFIGYQSGISTVGGGSNVFVGTQAGYSNISGSYNIALGRQAGYYTTGSSNIFLGDLTAKYNTTGHQNVMIGDWAGYHNTEGIQNVFLGAEAGWYNTTGSNNIFLGYDAGYNNTTGYDNIAIGNLAGENLDDGTYNTMVGSSAGNLNTSGDYNTVMGYKAGEKTTASWNSMYGYLAGNATTTGGSQVLLGYQAGMSNTSGWNTMVGSLAGGASGGGTYDTYLGLAAGEQATGDYNVFIGRWAGRYESTNSNKLVIETRYEGTDNANNALIYGDFLAKTLRVNGTFSSVSLLATDDSPAILGQHAVTPYYGYGVKGYGGFMGVRGEASMSGSLSRYGIYGTASGGATNYGVYGTASGGATNYAGYFSGNVYATGTITQLSDKNYKKNILPLSGSLEKVLDLQGVTYEWKSEEELASIQTKSVDPKELDSQKLNLPKGTQLGVIAQDVEKVLPELVQTDANGMKSVDYIKIIPLLIEAIKDQQKQIEELKTLVNSLSSNKVK